MTNPGGTWKTQNKKIPGTYINVISTTGVATNLSERGIVAFAPESLNWGPEHEVLEITASEFQRNALELLGYSATAPEMKGIADIFKSARLLYLYRMNPATGTKAQVVFTPTTGTDVTVATAKWTGDRGNKLSVQIEVNINSPENPTPENPTIYDVTTYIDGIIFEEQTKIASMADLEDNAFLVWDDSATIQELVATASGGTNGVTTAADLEAALTTLESYSYNIFGTDIIPTQALGDYIVSYVKRIRENTGAKMQAVIYAPVGTAFDVDYEGIIAVENPAIVNDEGVIEGGFNEAAAVYWVSGAEAGADVNESLTGSTYTGSFLLGLDYTTEQLGSFIDNGRFAFYRSGDTVEVLRDINGFTSFTELRNQDFSNNQNIRIFDQLAIDTALMFNTTYKGKVPNDEIGRVSLKTQIAKIYEQMQALRAIEDFVIDDISVAPGDQRNAVYAESRVKPVNAMEFLYMNIRVI